eukprot:scaffold25307_cov168-Amphora_coffeaeformis.AAC.1
MADDNFRPLGPSPPLYERNAVAPGQRVYHHKVTSTYIVCFNMWAAFLLAYVRHPFSRSFAFYSFALDFVNAHVNFYRDADSRELGMTTRAWQNDSDNALSSL